MAGGVIKILDYADHAAQLGRDVRLWAPPLPDVSAAVSSLPVVERLLTNAAVTIRDVRQLDIPEPNPLIIFTEPTHIDRIDAVTGRSLGARLIHLIQGTRHANPRWQAGRNYRLLHRPMTRIAVSDQVAAAIGPHTNQRYPLAVILEGHDCDYFAGRPLAWQGEPDHLPLRVLYTTWKSDFGLRVAEHLRNDGRFEFTSIGDECSWPALRNHYHAADVLLCTPGPEEGFYLPGLEAMAARVAVVTPLVGGNEAYILRGDNALVTDYEDIESNARCLEQLLSPALRQRLIVAGQDTCDQHRLDRERSDFASLLATIDGN